MATPKVTVAIPNFNKGPLLRVAVESALKQTHADIEVLVVDNASTDGGLEVIRDLATDPRLRLVQNERNIEGNPNFQKAIDLSNGEYVKLLCSDDYLHPDAVRQMAEGLDNHPSVGLVTSPQVMVNEDGAVIRVQSFFDANTLIAGADAISLFLANQMNYIGSPSAVMFRRSLCGRFAWLFGKEYIGAMDLVSWFEVLHRSDLLYLKTPLCYYRQFAGNAESQPGIVAEWMLEYADILRDYFERGYLPDPQQRKAAIERSMACFRGQLGNERALEAKPDLGARLRQAIDDWLEYPGCLSEDRRTPEREGAGKAAAAPRTPGTVKSSESAGEPAQATGEPMVSIIVPTHNRPQMLREALESIAAQTFSDLEVIVVNDAGDDVEGMVTGLPAWMRARHIRHATNKGLAGARNTGVSAARGKYVTYLDDDDLFYPDHVETLVNTLEGSVFKVAYTDSVKGIQELRNGGYVTVAREPHISIDFDKDRFLYENLTPVLNVMHERDLLKVVGGFDESMPVLEDWELWIRLSREFDFVHIPKVTAEVRIRLDSSNMTSEGGKKFPPTRQYVFNKHRERYVALEAKRNAERSRQANLDALLAAGTATLEGGHPEQAATEFRRIARLHPTLTAAHTALATALMMLGRSGGAIQSLRRAAELSPDDSAVHNQLGVALYQSRDVAGAETSLLKARTVNPADVQPLLNLIDLYRGQDRSVEAAETAKEAISVAPWHPEVVAAFGKLSLESGDFEGATMALGRLRAVRPDHPAVGLLLRGVESDGKSRLTSIIVLVHNQLKYTEPCLESIARHTPEPHEIIVVDNGSTDGTSSFLRRCVATRSNVRVVVNRSNRGFAAGNNQGLALARGEYVVLLNNDTVVTEGWLGRMLSVFDRNPEVGIVGPVSNYVSGAQLVPEATYTSTAEMQRFAASWTSDHAGQSSAITRVVGFCLVARKSVIDLIGGLDEQFGSGNYEDDDFCLRARLAGFEARVASDAFVHHEGNRTFIGANIDWQRSMERNWELFKAKWGIPSNTPMTRGYRLPNALPAGLSVRVPLPEVHATYRAADGENWREEPIHPLITVVNAESRESASRLLANLASAKRPMVVTLVAAARDGDAGRSERDLSGFPAGSSITKSDRPLLPLLNQLIQESGPEPVLLLSSDLNPPPQAIESLVAASGRNPDAAIVGPVSNQAPKPQRIKVKYEGTGKELRRFAERRAREHAEKTEEASYLGGFCLVFNPGICREVGPLREDAGLADALWEYFGRVMQAGYKVRVAHDAYVHHERLTDPEGANYDELAAAHEAVAQLLAAGQAAMDAGDVETATREFELVVRQLPGLAVGHASLASCLMAQGRFGDAVPVLERAIGLAPSAHLHNQLGVALFQNEDPGGAEAAFLEGRKADRKDVQSLLNLITLYQAQERYVEATQLVKEALEIDPDHPEVLIAFGGMSLELGDLEGGKLALQRLEAISPDDPACGALRQAIEQANDGSVREAAIAGIG